MAVPFPPAGTEALEESVSPTPKGSATRVLGLRLSQLAGLLGPDLQPWVCGQVEQQLIRYVHDGSETLTDSFVLVANASEMDRQSHPAAFTVTILPVNDQPPILTTNTGLKVRAAWDHLLTPFPKRGPAHSSPSLSLNFLL